MDGTWLFVALFVFSLLLLARRGRRRFDAGFRRQLERQARGIRDRFERLFGEDHELVPVRIEEIGRLDRAFYGRVRSELEALDFRLLGDFEDPVHTRAYPEARSCTRLMPSRDGRTVAAIQHMRLRGAKRLLAWVGRVRRDVRAVELTSELEDGRFVLTNNTQGVGKFPYPEAWRVETLEETTPVAELVRRHRESVRRAGAAPLLLADRDAVLASVRREWRARTQHWHARGGLTRNEWNAIVGRRTKTTDALYEILQETQ